MGVKKANGVTWGKRKENIINVQWKRLSDECLGCEIQRSQVQVSDLISTPHPYL